MHITEASPAVADMHRSSCKILRPASYVSEVTCRVHRRWYLGSFLARHRRARIMLRPNERNAQFGQKCPIDPIGSLIFDNKNYMTLWK